MKLTLMELFRMVIPLSSEKKHQVNTLKEFFNDANLKQIAKLLKIGRIQVTHQSFGTSSDFLTFTNYPVISTLVEDEEVLDFVKKANEKIEEKVEKEAFKRFSLEAHSKIPSIIAPNIQGMDEIKLACAIQLFSDERTHILLLGDPGTGKTDIIRSTADLHPKSSFGLGSGTSGAGLGLSFKGSEKIKGLLPLADGGLCCIDELNLLKQEDRASLYNAMEKGFITYDKGNKHIKEDADVCILATANPKGDKFAGWIVETLKKQLPFDSALLTRFHLVFLIRRPEIKEFISITRHILKGDKKKEFEANKKLVRDYVHKARELKVEFPKKFEDEVVRFIESIKENEDKYLVDISPRLVVGFMRLAKASARMDYRKYVTSVDLERVKKIFTNSLEIKRNKNSK